MLQGCVKMGLEKKGIIPPFDEKSIASLISKYKT